MYLKLGAKLLKTSKIEFLVPWSFQPPCPPIYHTWLRNQRAAFLEVTCGLGHWVSQ